jgi:hypothetical protein
MDADAELDVAATDVNEPLVQALPFERRKLWWWSPGGGGQGKPAASSRDLNFPARFPAIFSALREGPRK